jgi:ribonuclease PH
MHVAVCGRDLSENPDELDNVTTIKTNALRRMMRSDGRRADELRPLNFEVDYTEQPLGSVLCTMGKTKVLCTVSEELSVPRWLRGGGKGWLTAEYSMLPAATDRRTDREATRGKVSGRTMEIQRLIGRSLRAVVPLESLGERTLWVDCDVLQADGGTRTASISGAFVSLALALARLDRRGDLQGPPLRDHLAAISVGVIGGEVMLDLPYEEDARAEVDMNVVATGAGRFVEVQGTGEDGTFDRHELDQLLDLALGGIGTIIEHQTAAIEEAGYSMARLLRPRP